jgi:hypothetical protein
MATALKAARVVTGWSKPHLVERMRHVAVLVGEDLPQWTTMRVQIAHWENGRHRPCAFYQRVFCEVYGRTPEQLGFPPPRIEGAVGVEVVTALLYVAPLTLAQLRRVPATRVRLYVEVALADPRTPTPTDLAAGLHRARAQGPAWLDRDRLRACEHAAHHACTGTPAIPPGWRVGTVPDWVTTGRLVSATIAAEVFTNTG